MNALDRQVESNRTVGDVVFGPIDERRLTPTVVDVVARNGMIMPTSYSKRAGLIGFEPNVEEYRTLLAHDTDAMWAGVPIASFKNRQYHNCALWDENVSRSFYITAGPGACTLLGKNG